MDEIMAILDAHVERWDSDCMEHNGCSCGDWVPSTPLTDFDKITRTEWRQHLATMLTEGE